ncbi:hypothetical protein [Piscirickettsia salmonis]|uniref:hypothetical protein n=1 Tax=Piscirickettsia salmonis TaxID=1238 RepID=UPI0007C96C68|nr:hypothetical protein A0O36_00590 [Piscirickettsiaceae bacterium NZ-RLO1]
MPRDSIGFSQASLKRLALTDLKELEEQLSRSKKKLLTSQKNLKHLKIMAFNPDQLRSINGKLHRLKARQKKTEIELTQRLKAIRLEILIKEFDKELECQPTAIETADKEQDHLQTEETATQHHLRKLENYSPEFRQAYTILCRHHLEKKIFGELITSEQIGDKKLFAAICDLEKAGTLSILNLSLITALSCDNPQQKAANIVHCDQALVEVVEQARKYKELYTNEYREIVFNSPDGLEESSSQLSRLCILEQKVIALKMIIQKATDPSKDTQQKLLDTYQFVHEPEVEVLCENDNSHIGKKFLNSCREKLRNTIKWVGNRFSNTLDCTHLFKAKGKDVLLHTRKVLTPSKTCLINSRTKFYHRVRPY